MRKHLVVSKKSADMQVLWQAAHEVCAATFEDFERRFEHVDLWATGQLAARQSYEAQASAWAGRRVVMVGLAVLAVLWQTRPSSGALWQSHAGYDWCWLPSPLYGPLEQRVIGLRLEEMLA